MSSARSGSVLPCASSAARPMVARSNVEVEAEAFEHGDRRGGDLRPDAVAFQDQDTNGRAAEGMIDLLGSSVREPQDIRRHGACPSDDGMIAET